MNFDLTDDQRDIMDGLDQLIGSFAIQAPREPMFAAYAKDLDNALANSGFLEIAREEGFGPLEAALIVERLARLPCTVEAGATALIAPGLRLETGRRPIALARGALDAPARYLPMAQLLLVDLDDDVAIVEVDDARVETIMTLFAYPYGRIADATCVTRLGPAMVPVLRRRWRIALAAEAAGCMQAALDTIIDHVRMRHAFGRPLGAFQAIQHRLAMAAETCHSARWLALRAAWSDEPADAAIAAGFVQDRVPSLTYDLHQFAGAMGLTLEFPLHFWTYRLRALLGELGGSSVQARAAALATWGCAA